MKQPFKLSVRLSILINSFQIKASKWYPTLFCAALASMISKRCRAARFVNDINVEPKAGASGRFGFFPATAAFQLHQMQCPRPMRQHFVAVITIHTNDGCTWSMLLLAGACTGPDDELELKLVLKTLPPPVLSLFDLLAISSSTIGIQSECGKSCSCQNLKSASA